MDICKMKIVVLNCMINRFSCCFCVASITRDGIAGTSTQSGLSRLKINLNHGQKETRVAMETPDCSNLINISSAKLGKPSNSDELADSRTPSPQDKMDVTHRMRGTFGMSSGKPAVKIRPVFSDYLSMCGSLHKYDEKVFREYGISTGGKNAFDVHEMIQACYYLITHSKINTTQLKILTLFEGQTHNSMIRSCKSRENMAKTREIKELDGLPALIILHKVILQTLNTCLQSIHFPKLSEEVDPHLRRQILNQKIHFEKSIFQAIAYFHKYKAISHADIQQFLSTEYILETLGIHLLNLFANDHGLLFGSSAYTPDWNVLTRDTHVACLKHVLEELTCEQRKLVVYTGFKSFLAAFTTPKIAAKMSTQLGSIIETITRSSFLHDFELFAHGSADEEMDSFLGKLINQFSLKTCQRYHHQYMFWKKLEFLINFQIINFLMQFFDRPLFLRPCLGQEGWKSPNFRIKFDLVKLASQFQECLRERMKISKKSQHCLKNSNQSKREVLFWMQKEREVNEEFNEKLLEAQNMSVHDLTLKLWLNPNSTSGKVLKLFLKDYQKGEKILNNWLMEPKN